MGAELNDKFAPVNVTRLLPAPCAGVTEVSIGKARIPVPTITVVEANCVPSALLIAIIVVVPF